jgi:hypothetical protein
LAGDYDSYADIRCPELGQTVANPEGTRDCGPGCIPESEFNFNSAMTELDKLQRHLFSEEPPADEWVSLIENAASVAVLRGTLLQLQMEIASKAGGDGYETVRRRYCDFLKDGANYLD